MWFVCLYDDKKKEVTGGDDVCDTRFKMVIGTERLKKKRRSNLTFHTRTFIISKVDLSDWM